MTQRISPTAVPARHASSHGHCAQLARHDSSVRPLLLTTVTTLMLAITLVVLAATNVVIGVVDVGTMAGTVLGA